ncbi:MAG TPA: RDD family protein, partial [Pyrinomonadaceae bacterium]|nr:RDD family protein [Pyrinomonadaceae bacterium]
VIDDSWLSRLEDEILPKAQTARRTPDDTAPALPRVAAALIDLLLVAFLSSPFAAIIELTSGNWSDPRVAASMGGIVLVVMFLYLTGSTALAGRTWGMSLFSLHTVDAETALAPSAGQSARRALVYMLSLATLGIGIIYALFDAERRAAHDHLSGTVVVRE